MGISFSATNRRRSPTPYYPPPAYPVDPYSPYPVNSPVSYPSYPPNAFCAGNHSNTLVGQPSFGVFHSQHLPFQWQPILPLPREVGPPSTEQTQAKVVRSDVNVHKDSVRLEVDETNPGQFLISFVFDALVDGRSYLLENTLCQVQITQVVLDKNHGGQLTVKVIRQLLWTDGISYELREIYGFGKSTPGFSDSGSGKECVICMTEPKDIVVLPCRHMCMCSNCAKTLRLQSNKCPICRETIEEFLEIKLENFNP